MNTHPDRSGERPVLVYRLDETPSIVGLFSKVQAALTSTHRTTLVSSSLEETKALIEAHADLDLVIFIADHAGEILLKALADVRHTAHGRELSQMAFVGPMDDETSSSLYDSGVDHVLSLNLTAANVLSRIQKVLSQGKALHALKADKNQIRKVLEMSPAFIWLLKTPKQWSYINQAAREFVGGERKSNWSAAIYPEDMGILIKSLESVWQTKLPGGCEVRVQTANGQTRSVQHSFAILPGDHESPAMIIGSGIDVTEFRVAEKIFNDRQRYMTAYALIQKLFSNSTDVAKQMTSFKAIASQALNVRDIAIFVMDTPDDLATLRPPYSSKKIAEEEPNEPLFFSKLKDIPDLMPKLAADEPSTVSIGTENISAYPILKESRVSGLLIIFHHPRVKFGRFELDFIRNIKSSFASERNW